MKSKGTKKSTKQTPPARKRILIVEDDESLRESMVKIVELGGYAVVGVENGVAALEAMLGETFHLVLTDVAMPDMDGHELVLKLADHFPKVPVLVTSGTRAHHTRFTPIATPNVRGFLLKPVSIDTLITAVLSAIK